MKVNVVLWQDNHILPRMTEWLVERNGWTVSDKPDYSADVNYFMPYFTYAFDLHLETKTTGWFTHYEIGSQWKIDKWNQAAVDTDMQCITAPMYCDPQFGLGNPYVITPGVDRDRFVPMQREANKQPIVGIAGVGQPRKGPKLIVDLYYSGLGVAVNIVGVNWPFYPQTEIHSDQMPLWYPLLDVYLCTSSIEGIPAPVLEALACDVKIVIPYGVGICDQLPEMEGIRHYEKDNGQDMIRALQLALDDKPSKGSLRDVTKYYSVDEWCNSHQLAMEALLDAPVLV